MNVYFLKTKNRAQLIKIGKAKDVAQRVAELQTGCPAGLELMATIRLHSDNHARHVEASLHRTFKRYRVRGEWYRLGKPLQEFIAAVSTGNQEGALIALQRMN